MGKSLLSSSKDEERVDVTSKHFKSSISENTLFRINSQVLNIQNNKHEIISSIDCFYSPANEALCVIVDEKVKISSLSREIISNIMEFAAKAAAKSVILLLDKKNKEYIKIMQSMMMIGFMNDANYRTANLMEKEYKLLKLDVKHQELEEIAF